jgi:hypothetical protein
MIRAPAAAGRNSKSAADDKRRELKFTLKHAEELYTVSSISSLFSIAGNGLSSASYQMSKTAQQIAGPNGLNSLPQSAVDLTNEKTSFKADALLLKTANQMTGTLLNILDTDPR